MNAAKVTITLSPTDFDLMRATLEDRANQLVQLEGVTADRAEKRKITERIGRIRDLLTKLT